MKFEETRFKSFLSELGLPSSYKSGKQIHLYQGATDTVVFGRDILGIRAGNIETISLVNGAPKLSFLELEEVMTISEKIKLAGFPMLEVSFSKDSITAQPVSKIPVSTKSDELVGLPASSGKITAICLVYPTSENPAGKIVVMKNSKDLHLVMKHRPVGIILEEGNLLSHAAILAREAGIPAIVKVVNATEKLKTGEEVQLDASLGVIRIPKPR